MSHFTIRLYVKSVKTVTGTVQAMYRRWGARGFDTKIEPKYDHVLPEEHQKMVETVKRLARVHDLEVEIVDVATENVFRRVMQEELEKIKIFPTLVAGSQYIVEADLTEESVESLFSRIAGESKKKYFET